MIAQRKHSNFKRQKNLVKDLSYVQSPESKDDSPVSDAKEQEKSCFKSFGFVLLRWNKEEKQYNLLLVQRKWSIGFFEIIRGNYSLQNLKLIQRLVDDTTQAERTALLTQSFPELFKMIFSFDGKDPSFSVLREKFQDSQMKFNTIARGCKFYTCNKRPRKKPEVEISFDHSMTAEKKQSHKSHYDRYHECAWDWKKLVNLANSASPFPSFGFPKGKKTKHETTLQCAIRELQEETGMDVNQCYILSPNPLFVESFVGINWKKYEYSYYLALCKPVFDQKQNIDSHEIGKATWCSFDKAKYLFENKPVKLQLLNSISTYIQTHLPPIVN